MNRSWAVRRLEKLARENVAPLVEMLQASPDCVHSDIVLTVSVNEALTDIAWQTGDSSFTGGAYSYPHWAVAEVNADDCRFEIAERVIDQWYNCFEWRLTA